MKELVAQKGYGGVIAVNRKGDVATPFNTPGMITGVARPGPIAVSSSATAMLAASMNSSMI